MTDTRARLEDRLRAELEAADRKIEEIQEEAARVSLLVEERRERFEEIAERIVTAGGHPFQMLADRFDNATRVGSEDRHGLYVEVHFKHTSRFPATVELRFSLTHDDEVRKLTASIDASILPVFIEFERHDDVTYDLEAVDQETLLEWVEDKIVEFVRTYLRIQFVDRYQQRNLVTDPVAATRFPKHLVKSTVEYRGQTYSFISDETRRRFEEDPEEYVSG